MKAPLSLRLFLAAAVPAAVFSSACGWRYTPLRQHQTIARMLGPSELPLFRVCVDEPSILWLWSPDPLLTVEIVGEGMEEASTDPPSLVGSVRRYRLFANSCQWVSLWRPAGRRTVGFDLGVRPGLLP
jgi:hypothetical protein